MVKITSTREGGRERRGGEGFRGREGRGREVGRERLRGREGRGREVGREGKGRERE